MTDGYKSPIEVVMQNIQFQMENDVYQAIKKYGINVDKDELIKALQYDREQYKEGFYDGYRAFANQFYGAFIEHYKCYKEEGLVKMSTVVDLIREVKDEVYEK